MATGKEIVKELVKLTYRYYNLAIPDFYDSVNDDFIPTDEAILLVKNQPQVPQKIKELLDCFHSINLGSQFMSDVFQVPNKIEVLDFNDPLFLKRNRPFYISDLQFGYLSTKKLLQLHQVSEVVNDHEGYKTLIDFVGAAILLNTRGELDKLFTILENSIEHHGLLVHKFNHSFSSLSIYSYLYFQELVLGGRIELDPSLNYTGSHGVSITFNNTIAYQQYFELFDIVSELNHSREIITRFLKVYHLLEYLVYRVELVQLEIKARVNRSFIREIHGLTGKNSGEWDILKRNFEKIFSSEVTAGYFNLGTLSIDQNKFFKEYLGLHNFNHRESNQVAQVIYRLRNSIVHNKESEFHMTTTNPDDYSVVIPLVNLLIQKLEKVVFDKIALNFNAISYQNPSIELY